MQYKFWALWFRLITAACYILAGYHLQDGIWLLSALYAAMGYGVCGIFGIAFADNRAHNRSKPHDR